MRMQGVNFSWGKIEETEEERRKRLALAQMNYQQFKPETAPTAGTSAPSPWASSAPSGGSSASTPAVTDWRPSYQTVRQTASVQKPTIQTPAASSSAQDWRPSYQREITPSPVTRTNEEGFNLPAAFGSALEEIGTKYRNMSAGETSPVLCRRRITSPSPMGNGARA
ncbi:MAG: hypothetical protein IJT94_12270 [Oscillibacter sp.]|nr:hypothetical protein [Oscillibacter sp.]